VRLRQVLAQLKFRGHYLVSSDESNQLALAVKTWTYETDSERASRRAFGLNAASHVILNVAKALFSLSDSAACHLRIVIE